MKLKYQWCLSTVYLVYLGTKAAGCLYTLYFVDINMEEVNKHSFKEEKENTDCKN